MNKVLFAFISLSLSLSGYSQAKGKSTSKLEEKILDTIWKLPEVKQEEKLVRKLSKNKRHLSVSIFELPSDKSEDYWIKVCEDNGIMCATSFDFYVNPVALTIKFYDPVRDKLYDLKSWRKKR